MLEIKYLQIKNKISWEALIDEFGDDNSKALLSLKSLEARKLLKSKKGDLSEKGSRRI